MTSKQRIEKLERQQQQLVACTMALAGIVLEYAKRDLGGEGPAGLTGDMVASKGLLLLGHNKPCPTGAEVVERVAQVLNLLRDEPLQGAKVEQERQLLDGNRVDNDAPGIARRMLSQRGVKALYTDVDSHEIIVDWDDGSRTAFGYTHLAYSLLADVVSAWKPFVRRAFELMEDEDGSKELEDFLMSFDQIPEDLRP